jgi:uncharacterized protein YjbI with pentapeptide repeats
MRKRLAIARLLLALQALTMSAALAQSQFESSKLSPGVVTQGADLQSSKLSSGVVVQGGDFRSSKLSSGVVVQGGDFRSSKLSVGVVFNILVVGGNVIHAPLTHW